MKIKLVHKFFATFLLTFFIIVGLMVGGIQISAYRTFADYVGRMELEQLDPLVEQLTNECRRHGGWGRIKNNYRLWREYLRIGLSPQASGGDTPGYPPPLRPSVGPSPGADVPFERRLPPQRVANTHSQSSFEGTRYRLGAGENLLDLKPRVSLLDLHKKLIQGPATHLDGLLLREIELDGEPIGWLALRKNENLSHPLDVDYMRQQINIIYYIGGGAIILTIIASFILARHLLLPIRQLADGTKNLTARNFKTAIQVASKDELGQLADDFNKLARTLDQYEQLRQQWISDISHELRTPLAVLRGEIDALIDGVRQINTKTLTSLQAEVIHISKIVNDLHYLSIAESGTLQFKSEPIDPLAILHDTLHRFESRLHAVQIECTHDLHQRSKVMIRGDRDRLMQLYNNLLENCLRYTAAPGRIVVSHRIFEQFLSIHIEDTAPGVPYDALHRIFDRLYRVDSARSRTYGGSGLGLSICRHIVINHQGQIFAEPSELGGLKISIRFALQKHA